MTTKLEQQLSASIVAVRAKRIRGKMSEAIVVHRDVSGPLEFSAEQQQMIRDSFARGATEAEFRVLLEIAKVRRLNPLLRQIHFVSRKDKKLGRDVWTPQVSIDGLRAVAERTGLYAGQDEPEYELDKEGYIISCKVKVYRKDWGNRPAVGVAHWNEYVQTNFDGEPTKFWKTMPRVMIAKCAESIALRKAFPEDLSGIYTDEEMEQADNALPDNGSPGALSPHAAPGEDQHAEEDADVASDLRSKLEQTKADLATCDSYDKALALAAIIGSKAKQSELTRRIQQAGESGEINASTKAELGKLWQHCFRQVEKRLKELAPSAEDVAHGDDTEREPGEEG